jgi:geranylgeranyl diphosphate synthase type II
MTFSDYATSRAEIVNEALNRLTPPKSARPAVIHDAMRYSLFAGGKRIRPLLAMAAGECIGGDVPGLADAACALECIHTYSLIHDDLPALDNDDLRRGRPTNHKVFGEAMAILAGDALLTLAFEILGKLDHCPPERRIRLVTELATASGTVGGMIGGQVEDLEGEKLPATAELLERIHRAKTGALLRASVRIGAIYAGADDRELAQLSKYGEHVGLAFQIVDDVLDIEQTSEHLGKTAGKDAAQHKVTFPAVYGLDESRRMAAMELGNALDAVSGFGERAVWLREIARTVVHRTK